MADLSITDDLILKVHTGPDGKVWYLDGDRLPEASGKPVASFMESAVVRKADKVRLIGTPDNAELVTLLYAKKLREELVSVEVCSPLACEPVSRREKPEHVLLDLRKWTSVRPSVGGWHEVEANDQASYLLALSVQRKEEPNRISRLLSMHPVWYALAGMPHINRSAVGRLVAEVIDPRFFIDQDEPDRLSKLESFLGLEPKIAAIEGGSAENNPHHRRYRTVLESWKNDDPGAEASGAPELFIWEEYHKTSGSWKKDLRASQKFLHYLRHTWLDALYPRQPWAETLFVPEHFFSDDRKRINWYKNQLKRKK